MEYNIIDAFSFLRRMLIKSREMLVRFFGSQGVELDYKILFDL